MASEHSPAPFTVTTIFGRHHIYDGDGIQVANNVPVEADARLFAAAPKLLAALEWASDALRELAGSGAEVMDAELINATGNDDHAGLYAAVMDAIAEARGEARGEATDATP
jgi:hypothetical protein